jgi:hypothetical protein
LHLACFSSCVVGLFFPLALFKKNSTTANMFAVHLLRSIPASKTGQLSQGDSMLNLPAKMGTSEQRKLDVKPKT